jgi:hypothetical protein
MTRNQLIERILRQIYGGQPTDDSNITFNLVNQWLNDAIGGAVKKNYTDSIQMDGVAYINNSFYTTYSGLVIAPDGSPVNMIYKFTLPQLPLGLGRNEGVASVQFKDTSGRASYDAVPLSINQVSYIEQLRPIQNKIVYWSEGTFIYAKTSILLNKYTASVRMISGGDSSDLNSILLIPDDYMPFIIEYIKGQLAFEESRPIDTSNDGNDH